LPINGFLAGFGLLESWIWHLSWKHTTLDLVYCIIIMIIHWPYWRLGLWVWETDLYIFGNVDKVSDIWNPIALKTKTIATVLCCCCCCFT